MQRARPASGPYMLVMKADDRNAFLRYAQHRPAHQVRIHWSRRFDGGQTWHIVPLLQQDAYRLSFKLPERLADWIFTSGNVRRAAATTKEMLLAYITIFRRGDEQDQLIRLSYVPGGGNHELCGASVPSWPKAAIVIEV